MNCQNYVGFVLFAVLTCCVVHNPETKIIIIDFKYDKKFSEIMINNYKYVGG